MLTLSVNSIKSMILPFMFVKTHEFSNRKSISNREIIVRTATLLYIKIIRGEYLWINII